MHTVIPAHNKLVAPAHNPVIPACFWQEEWCMDAPFTDQRMESIMFITPAFMRVSFPHSLSLYDSGRAFWRDRFFRKYN